MSEPDVYLELLKKVDRQVEDQGRDIKGLRSDLSDGRLVFADHAARLSTVERDQAACAERVKLAVRDVLNEQRETDRMERKTPSQKKGEKSPGETTGLMRALAKMGPFVRYGIIVGAFLGGLIGGVYATRQTDKAPQTQGTPR